MTYWRTVQFLLLFPAVGMLIGCLQADRRLTYLGEADLKYYKDYDTQIDYPDNYVVTPEHFFAEEPNRLSNRERDEIWNMTLNEAIYLALQNNEVIRSAPEFLSPGNTLLANPNLAPSIYDPAIRDTGVLFGQRGVDAALADFDAQFTTSMTWARNEQPRESLNNFGRTGEANIDETGDFRSQLQKTFADGSQFAVTHNWFYSGQNVFDPSFRLFPSHFTSRPGTDQNPGLPTLGFVFRRPLWAASGTDFNRIAGPNARALSGVTGVSQGVVIARINTDIAIADFEASVRNLVRDVENAYWNLYLAYRVYDAETVARISALETFRIVERKYAEGLPGGSAAELAQAEDTFFELRARSQDALSSIYTQETVLRRLLGLPVSDGKIIRPTEEPITAELAPDWQASLVEALTRRVELRRQKWNIKSFELQLEAARSLTKPQLDFVSRYHINAFGDKLFSSSDGDRNSSNPLTAQQAEFRSAYDTLTGGDYTGWGIGFEFQMPIGFRAARSQVRNLELQLAKAQAVLAAQELEIGHELATAFQALDRAYFTARTNYSRRAAALRRVEAYEIDYENNRATLDLVLRSQISLAQAEIQYFQSVIAYNQAITDLMYRKGTLLEDHSIFLAEGSWDPAAYRDALRRAWARSHAFDADKFKYTAPEMFSVRDYPAFAGWLPPVDEAAPPAEPFTPDGGLPPVPAPEEDGRPPLPSPSDYDPLEKTAEDLDARPRQPAVIELQSEEPGPLLEDRVYFEQQEQDLPMPPIQPAAAEASPAPLPAPELLPIPPAPETADTL